MLSQPKAIVLMFELDKGFMLIKYKIRALLIFELLKINNIRYSIHNLPIFILGQKFGPFVFHFNYISKMLAQFRLSINHLCPQGLRI